GSTPAAISCRRVSSQPWRAATRSSWTIAPRTMGSATVSIIRGLPADDGDELARGREEPDPLRLPLVHVDGAVRRHRDAVRVVRAEDPPSDALGGRARDA